MQIFEYTVQDENGIHARPAGMLVKEVKKYKSTVMIEAGEKKADAARMIAVMSLGIKKGEKVKITIDGADEKEAYDAIKIFFEENL